MSLQFGNARRSEPCRRWIVRHWTGCGPHAIARHDRRACWWRITRSDDERRRPERRRSPPPPDDPAARRAGGCRLLPCV